MAGEVGVELGAMLSTLLRRVAAAEQAVLDEHDLGMWDHAVLYALRAGAAASQAELAEATGRDKTRLIRHLDALEARGLITRTPNPQDRRLHVVTLTEAGRAVLGRCHERITEAEDTVLGGLSTDDAQQFRRLLTSLTRD
ncbi:MarR family winged helix-turn-helix transcriptional regulator [Nocardioides pantholopis]|uniref:MarR family winged helix-turn-helix transcriptional regulator n=1 Tax=Nocardioides pantholopis TaxID=2483798 RepID=UPI001F150113|nr:MarR family transcriptional regulator [Nocardioides pantholopis]